MKARNEISLTPVIYGHSYCKSKCVKEISMWWQGFLGPLAPPYSLHSLGPHRNHLMSLTFDPPCTQMCVSKFTLTQYMVGTSNAWEGKHLVSEALSLKASFFPSLI